MLNAYDSNADYILMKEHRYTVQRQYMTLLLKPQHSQIIMFTIKAT